MRMPSFLQALLIVSATAGLASAQAPVEDGRPRQDSILQSQQKASAAYREMQQAEQARKFAEQDVQRVELEYKAAQKRADDIKHQFDSANAQLTAAKAREAQARKQYDAALNVVDQTFGKSPSK
jgi:septal ring factor EnvC (AmiA/AmiB activator)